jgi:hypothetical protein
MQRFDFHAAILQLSVASRAQTRTRILLDKLTYQSYHSKADKETSVTLRGGDFSVQSNLAISVSL